MNQKEPTPSDSQAIQPQEPQREERREWREPIFERKTLKEAMTANFSLYGYDGLIYYS